MIKRIINTIAGCLGIKRRMFIAPAADKPVPASISYAITVCNEAEALCTLLDFLQPYLQPGDEIIVQADRKNVTAEVQQVVQDHTHLIRRYVEHDLDYDFARAKNHLNTQCCGEWIFQLDADECPQTSLLQALPAILQANPGVELYKMPRMNSFVDGQGRTEKEYVAWPDYQGRLYRNDPQRIRWHRPIHEKIRGHKAYVYLPKEEKYAIRHRKVTEQDKAKWQNWRQHYT
jgi:hypothetical protein